MSNLQDVPLADPEGLPVVDGSEATPAPKSSSLKRFFKISKKPLMRDHVEEVSETSSQDNRELGRSNTISRFFTRLKGSNKDGQEQSSSIADPVEHDQKPMPNAKPTIKTSISTYWKLLFHRQKNHRQNAGFGLSQNAEGESEEVHELQPVNHESETEFQSPVKVEEAEVEESGTDSEPSNPKAKKSVANKASGEEILNALEGGQLSIAEREDEEAIQPAPTSVNQFK
ncbi:uncharacterized protein [Drosophila takahashii]|uniref:uncharacterized protein n=1 Tax=Drosophila takahashii TaxID=29030 RepID=UPI001CF83C87|nr:uncharacterized protein LOC108055160 [Drosophila takahashii]